MLATSSTKRRSSLALKCYADNSLLNYVDPTGTTQAGNPLTNLFAGGYSSGTVADNKFVNPYVASGAGPSAGTLGRVVGNAVYSAAVTYAPISTSIASAGTSLFSNPNSQRGTYGPFPSELNSQVVADLRNQGRVTSPAEGVLVIRYSDAQGNDKKALVERSIQQRGRANVWTQFDVINTAPISVKDKDLAEIVQNQRFINNVNDFVGVTNVATAVTPYVSDARDVIEFKTGRDAITQQALTPTGRFLTGIGVALPIIGGVLLRKAFGATGEVYDVGKASDLRNTSIPFTEVHHAPQSRQAESLVGEFSTANRAGKEPAIRLPISEHTAVSAAQANRRVAASARDLLADEIRILRNFTNAPNDALRKLIQLNKDVHFEDYLPLHRAKTP